MGEQEAQSTEKVVMEAAMEVNKIDVGLHTYEAVTKFKSIKRAMRRGHVSPNGVVYPRRPFNNRKNKPLENLKRRIYNEIKSARIKEVGV